MSEFLERHINNAVDAFILTLIGGGAIVSYLMWGYDGRSVVIGYLIFRIFAVGYSADKRFNDYLEARYGRWDR